MELHELVQPASTAVVVMEMKRLTVGDLRGDNAPTAPGAPLGAAGEEIGLVDQVARLADAARGAGMRVIHCTAAFRADGAGSMASSPILASALRHRHQLLAGSPQAEPALELYEPDDLRSVRFHGVAPFIGTDLDPLLRSLGVKSVVLVGGSLNVGIVGAAVEAVDFGYRVVIPRDAVVGVPAEYAEMMFEHTLRMLAWLTTVDDLIAEWADGTREVGR